MKRSIFKKNKIKSGIFETKIKRKSRPLSGKTDQLRKKQTKQTKKKQKKQIQNTNQKQTNQIQNTNQSGEFTTDATEKVYLKIHS